MLCCFELWEVVPFFNPSAMLSLFAIILTACSHVTGQFTCSVIVIDHRPY